MKNLFRPLYHKFIWCFYRVQNKVPQLKVIAHEHSLVRLGTVYGGWTFVNNKSLYNSVIVSCGLGEDASFDIEFASQYGAKIVIVDPTPRAITHFHEIIKHLGRTRVTPYSTSGTQPIEAYDLTDIRQHQLELCAMALWNENTTLKFYPPPDSTHVSYSILNYQRNYEHSNQYIEVPSICIDELCKQFSLNDIKLIKLDIEGAEVELILDMMSKCIFPEQILVEYDELSTPSIKSKNRIESAHRALLAANYKLIHREHTNFTYLRDVHSSS